MTTCPVCGHHELAHFTRRCDDGSPLPARGCRDCPGFVC